MWGAGMSEALFAIPERWEPTTLGEICRRGGGGIQTGPFGSQLHASDYVPCGIPSIMPQNIGDNRIREKGIARITEDDAQRLSRYLVRSGDIVYSRRGDVERRALIRGREDGWLCGTGCLRVRFGEGVVHPPYAAFYLGHPLVREWIVRHAHGATMPNLNTSILSALPFVLPPMDDQRAIAHILATLDDKIELNGRTNETLEAMARAIFKSWFADFDPVRAKASGEPTESICRRLSLTPEFLALFPDGFEDSEFGGIPLGWNMATLSKFCELNAKSWSAKTLPDQVNYVDLANTKNGVINDVKEFASSEAPSRARRILRLGDTIIGTVRPGNKSFALVGTTDVQLTGSTGFAVLSPVEDYLAEIVYMIATAEENIERLARLADGGAYPAVSSEIVVATKCIQPTADIAKAFHRVVAPLMKMYDANTREIDALAGLRDSLLPKLLSGDLDPVELSGEYI